MQKIKIFIMTLSLICGFETFAQKKVLISQIVQHPALSKVSKGIIDKLNEIYGKEIKIHLEFAQGDIALASQIATKFVSETPDIVVGIGTGSAQSFMRYVKDKKVKMVFSSITDPISAGLVQSLDSKNDTSGVSNFIDLEKQIKLFKKIQPDIRILGVLYNPGEANSTEIVKRLRSLLPKFDIKLITQVVTKTTEIANASSKLASLVDAIFISNDNSVLSGLTSVIHSTNKAKIPLYVSDIDTLELGALAALGPNQYEIGIQTANIISDVLSGKNIKTIPVEFPKKLELHINKKVADAIGIKIDKKLIESADFLLK